MARLRNNNPGIRFLIRFWSKYIKAKEWHLSWARENLQVIADAKRGHLLYTEGENQRSVYMVAKGLIGRVIYDEGTGRRRILSVALPGMALMTTEHLYSATPSAGDLEVLHPGSFIIRIPYTAVQEFRETAPEVEVLIGVLSNKKKKQVSTLRRITLGRTAFESCLLLAEELPDLFRSLYQQEIADLLGISKTTVQSVSNFMAKRPSRRH